MRPRLPALFLLSPALLLSQDPALSAPARAVDSVLSAAAKQGFSGAALVIIDGKTVLHSAYGIAQRETNTPFRTNTLVQIGSNAKDFTAVAILQLMQQRRLALGDSLGKFFPAAPSDKRGITLWQLLRHTSGLPIGIGPDSQSISRSRFLDLALGSPLQFAPGTGEQYSNAGYSLLAAIIEHVAGRSYDEYVRDNVFVPLSMKETGYLLPAFDRSRVAHGYSASGDRGTTLDLPHPADGPSWTLRGNGGMLSTLSDMATFYNALFTTERLLPTAARIRMFDPQGGMILAGSDLTSYFMYQREPQPRLDIFLVSTTSDVRAPQLLRRIVPHLGVSEAAAESDVAVNAPAANLPATPVGNTIREYLEMFNGADSAAAVRFFSERMITGPDSPSARLRLGRLRDMRSDLGKLVPIGIQMQDEQRVELKARSSSGEAVTLLFELEAQPPYRIRSLRVRVGG